jgi:3-oxoacid CoA-transferase subunit B
VLDVLPQGGFKLIERAPGITVEEIKAKTLGRLLIEGDVPEMRI